MMHRIFLFIFSISFLEAIEPLSFDDPASYAVVNMHNPASSIVAGQVNVITGDFIVSEVDLVIPGAAPIVMAHYLTQEPKGFPWGTWRHEWMSSLDVKQKKNQDKKYVSCNILTPSGGHYCLENCSKNGLATFDFKKNRDGKGISNFTKGRPSGRNNLINFRAELDYYSEDGTLIYPSGERRTFVKSELKEVRKTNGAKLQFKYNPCKPPSGVKKYKIDQYYADLKNIGVTSYTPDGSKKTAYALLNHDEFHPDTKPFVTLQSYDGRQVKYHFIKGENSEEWRPGNLNPDPCWIISKVENSYKPTIDYSYEQLYNIGRSILMGNYHPEGRYCKVQRYKIDDTHNCGEDSWKDPQKAHDTSNTYTVTTMTEWAYGKVSHIQVPSGQDSSPVNLYRMEYFKEEFYNKYKDKRELSKGFTHVFDAYNNLTRYTFDPKFRLTEIEHCSNYQADVTEWFIWGGEKTAFRSNLVAKGARRSGSNEGYTISYNYDGFHNVNKETIWGNITGNNPTQAQPSIDEQGVITQIDGLEKQERKFFYYRNDFHLIKSETEPSGLMTEYEYLPDTDLVTLKTVHDQGKICNRQFFKYNKDHFLVEVIEDNGLTKNCQDLTGVTYRLIKRFKPKTGHCFGMPEVIEELYLDLDSKQEKALRKEVLTYAIDGQITKKIVYDNAQTLSYSEEWEYDSHGNCIQYKNPLGTILTMSYDANDNLIEKTGPIPGHIFRYSYDLRNQCIQKRETFPAGEEFTTTYAYDLMGRQVQEITPFETVFRSEYDSYGRPIKKILPMCKVGKNESLEPCISQEFDIFGNLTKVTDSKGKSTSASYNIFGKPTKILHPDCSEEKCIYGFDGFLKEAHAKNGVVTYYTQDSFGRTIFKEEVSPEGECLGRESFTYEGNNLVSNINVEGLETLYEYDGAGRKTGEKKGRQYTTFEYDSLGYPEKTHYWNEGKIVSSLIQKRDVVGQVIAETLMDGHGNIYKEEQFSYDELGHQISRRSQDSEWLTAYDPHGNIVYTRNPCGEETHYSYDYAFLNEFGQKVLRIIEISPLGVKTETIHDALGRVVAIGKRDPLGTLLSHEERYYDLSGNLIETVHAVIGREDINFEITEWSYDSMNRMISITRAKDTTSEQTYLSEYNSLGQRTTLTKPSGVTLQYSYNLKGMVESIKSSDQTIDYHYTYDKLGRVLRVDEPNGVFTERTYSPEGMMLSERLSSGLEVSYSYDDINRLASVRYPDGSKVSYLHSPLNMSQIERFMPSGRSMATSYTFDLGGHLVKEALNDHSQEISNSYDLNGRLTAIKHAAWEETDITYDQGGRILSHRFKDKDGSYSKSYQYSFLNQLVQENNGSDLNTYLYDSLDNRISKNDSQYSLNALNQVLSEESNIYSYDPDGRMTEKREPSGITSYSYDAFDRLTEVSFSNGDTYYYKYDPFHRRIEKRKEMDTSTFFVYQYQDEVGSMENGTMKEFRTLGLGIGAEIRASVFLEKEGAIFKPIHDCAGNMTALISCNANAEIESVRYSAFGETDPSNQLFPWGFSSKRFDAELGWVFFGRRYYDPKLGRWTTADPLGEREGPNLYAYVNNNPLVLHDLYGLAVFERCLTFVSPLAGLVYIHNTTDRYQVNEKGLPILKDMRHDYPDPGKVIKLQGWKTPYSSITVVNGIYNDERSAVEMGRTLQQMARGHEVNVFYNPKNDLLSPLDVVRAEIYDAGYTAAVENLSEHLESEINRMDESGVALVLSHSAGGATTRNAHIDLISKDESKGKRVRAVSFAPAAMTFSAFTESSIHYRSSGHDPIPNCDRSGNEREKHTLVDLEPDQNRSWGDYIFDHSFSSKTFEKELIVNIDKYFEDTENWR